MSRHLLLALVLAAGTARAELPSASTSAINQALISGRPTVIDLGARSCQQCKKMAPILESLATEYKGKAGVLFIDVSRDSASAERFKVRMIPTQIFFDARGKEVKRHIGFMDKTALVRELKAAGLK
jgi:thioredoxin 1